MKKALEALNRNTIAIQNGGIKDNSAMERFCELILETQIENSDAYRNRLEYISCCETLSPALKERIDAAKMAIDLERSKNEQVMETTKLR